MRILGVLCTFALFLFLIASGPGYAQDENKPQEQTKPEDNGKAKDHDKAKPQEDRNARPEESKPQEQPNARRQDEHQNQPDANRPDANRPEERRDHQQGQEQRPTDNSRRGDQSVEHQDIGHDQNQHPAAGRGRRIPDDQFRTHFGREHRFHVQRAQIVNVSQPVVVYGGYSFQLIDAWPAEWSYDDDCYIDYVDDQYYLFDVMHPGIRIAVFVVG